MRIAMLTIGTRGDVQPFVALGVGLRAAGYDVTIGTHRTFETFITGHDIDFAPLPGDPHALIERLASDKAGANVITFIRQFNGWFTAIQDDLLRAAWDACQNADMIIYGFLIPVGPSIAEKLQVPCAAGYLMPVGTVTSAYPAVTLPWLNGWDRFSHRVERTLMGVNKRGLLNRWRVDVLGLPPYPLHVQPYDDINGRPVHRFYAYSPQVIAQPADFPAHAHVTGYWFLDAGADWTPPPALEAFLNAGEAPVYAGFGSLIDRDAEALIETVVAAVRRAGKRLLLLGGWAGLNKNTLSDDVFVVKSAPHDWLFPRMAAVIHHGGAGTTAAGLRAGVPSVLVPFFGDQPTWGRVVHERGLGPAPVPASTLSAETLADAVIRATTDEALIQRAAFAGEAIRAEDGVGQTVRLIRDLVKLL